MKLKKGKVKVTVKRNGVVGEIIEYEVLEYKYETFNIVLTAQLTSAEENPIGIYEYVKCDLTDKRHLDSIFNRMGENEYEWLEPMTEVPSQGGGSGITILDVYPVGAEFTTTDTTFNPMKVWGGTWTLSLVGAKRVWTRTA